MKNISSLLIIFTFLTACTSATKNDLDASVPRIHNLAPDFIDYWLRVKDRPQGVQVSELKSDFFPKFPEFYKYKIERWKKAGKIPDEQIGETLKKYPQIESDFIKKSDEITTNLRSTMDSFLRAFPELRKDIDIYITHSFGEMDGGTRKIGNKIYFVFGIDGMAKFHQGFKSEIPFFHHELFHVYHSQYLQEEDALWNSLWVEGLATYASEQLNPNTSLKELMLDLPAGMVERIDANLDYHWADLNKKLNSKDESDYRTYFLMASKDTKIVIRAGYYLGYLIAKEIGKTKSLREMAQLKSYEILPLIKSEIQKLRSKRIGSNKN